MGKARRGCSSGCKNGNAKRKKLTNGSELSAAGESTQAGAASNHEQMEALKQLKPVVRTGCCLSDGQGNDKVKTEELGVEPAQRHDTTTVTSIGKGEVSKVLSQLGRQLKRQNTDYQTQHILKSVDQKQAASAIKEMGKVKGAGKVSTDASS